MSLDTLGLSPALLRAVADDRCSQPTPVRREAIPHVLAGRNVLASAQTGTETTAALVLAPRQRLDPFESTGQTGGGERHRSPAHERPGMSPARDPIQ
jgi:superfamily II DNA/RNA helicase